MLVIQRPTVEAIDESTGNTQQFAVGPLEPGFGHTLGNSLRRTLLSSVPGAAITQVRFEGTEHEFGTIDGVVDDITDIILGLKDMVVRSHSDEAVTVRLDASGPAAACRHRGSQPRPAPGHPQQGWPSGRRGHHRAGTGLSVLEPPGR
jgi:DNA-directed RNA polymerase subunit alpha